MSEKINLLRKRRLVIATDNFLPRWDGIARFLVEIIARLKDTYDITVLTANFEGHYDNPAVKIVRFPLRKFHIGDFPPAKPDRKVVNDEISNSDIVWVQTIGPIGVAAIKAARYYEKKIVAYNHSVEWELVPNAIDAFLFKGPIYEFTKIFSRNYYNKCDVLFVPTREVAEKLSGKGIKAKKVVIPLGVDSETFFPVGIKSTAKLEVGIDPSHFVVGYVGRIAHEKDLKTLLRAYIRLKRRHENARLLIVGDGVDSIKKALLSKSGVIVTGVKDNVVTYLHAMDVYVLSSLTETTSLSTLEAMSCELPVVVTKVGLAKEYIKNGVNGFLFDKKDTYSLYRHLASLIKDPALALRLGKNARKTVIDKFLWKNTVEKIKTELDKV